MRQRKSLPGQIQLPYSRGQKFRLLRAAVFHIDGKTPRAFRAVYHLIEQLELCTFADGCRVRRDVLAARMRCSTGTVDRAIRLAIELKILAVENDHANGGGMNRYQINWHAVYVACPMSERKQASEERDETETVETVKPVVPEVADQGEKSSPAEWKSVESSLRECHVKGWRKAASVARECGLTPGDCHALIAFAQQRPAGFWKDPATALYMRLTTAQRGEPAADGWLPASASFLQRERAEREKSIRERERSRETHDARQSSLERIKRDELEKEFGPRLDQMSKAEFAELAERVFAGNQFVLLAVRRGQRSGLVRGQLLKALCEGSVGHAGC